MPAAIGLFLLAYPVVGLAFEHGDLFLPERHPGTDHGRAAPITSSGLPFAAVDQVLIFASYARKNTLTPALVGVLSVVVYLVVAQLLIRPLGLFSLMIADSVKHMVHAGVMAYLLNRQLGGIRGRIAATTGQSSAGRNGDGGCWFGDLAFLMPDSNPTGEPFAAGWRRRVAGTWGVILF